MKTIIRTAMLSMALIVALNLPSFASGENATPYSFNYAVLYKSIVMNNKAIEASIAVHTKSAAKVSTAKVCSCEILRMKSTNDEYQNVAVMSEKVNNGDISNDLKIAASVIAQEKKQIKERFFDVVKTSKKVTAATDCKSLITVLKVSYDDLKVYDIIDADVRSQVKKGN